jgi:hypothetical protein
MNSTDAHFTAENGRSTTAGASTAPPAATCYALAFVPDRKTVCPFDRWSQLCDVMHLLSAPAWKVVTFIARDDLIRHGEEISGIGALRRDFFAVAGIDIGRATGSEERADLTMVSDEDPAGKWTRLSLAEICRGVRVPGKRSMQNRGASPRVPQSRRSRKRNAWGFSGTDAIQASRAAMAPQATRFRGNG